MESTPCCWIAGQRPTTEVVRGRRTVGLLPPAGPARRLLDGVAVARDELLVQADPLAGGRRVGALGAGLAQTTGGGRAGERG